MSKFASLILAAGKGTRMKSRLPKVLHEIAGQPMVNYVVAAISRLKPEKISVIVAPGMDSVKEAVLKQNAKVKFAVQKQQLGTGDAVKAGLASLGGNYNGDVVILYGDCPFISETTIESMLTALNSNENPAIVVLGFTPFDPGSYGRLVLNNRNELEAIVEFKDASFEELQIGLCNSGVMAVKGGYLKKFLNRLQNHNASGEYYLTDIVGIAREMGYACHVATTDEQEVMGINSKAELSAAENIMQSSLRFAAMELGATLIAPETVFLSADTVVSKNTLIQPYVWIGKGTSIDEGAVIRSFSHIEGARIGKNAIVGPFARLRPGADLADDVHVGNFVEVKNSSLKKGAKVNHLSYIGDASLGEKVNIGAGTITCNYDGKKKYKTEIGKGAFIGSNSSLVAPVKIGEGAVIGAGATITKNVEKGATVINEMPQKNLKKKK